MQIVLLDLLLLHHWLQCLFLLFFFCCNIEIAWSLFCVSGLFLNQLLQSFLGNNILFFDNLKERIHNILWSSAFFLLPTSLLTNFQQIEQLQHSLILSNLLNHLLMPKSGISLFFEPSINIIQFIIELNITLHYIAKADENIPELILKVYLVHLDTATSLHFAKLSCALIQAATQCLYTGLRGEEEKDVWGQLEAFHQYLVERRLEIDNRQAFRVEGLWTAGRLNEYHVHILLVHCDELLLADLDVALHLIHFGVVQQATQLFSIKIIRNHLHARCNVSQLYGCSAYPSKSIEDDLCPCTLAGNEL